jgi:seryl-tRNA synthetase
MINPKLLREDIDSVKTALKNRRMEDVVDLDLLTRIDDERRALITESDEFREKRNKLSKEIGTRKEKDEPAEELMREVKGLGERIREADDRLEELNSKYNDMLLSLPNILDASVPIGVDESDNQIVRSWGEKPDLPFEPKPHYEIGVDLNILDFERGVKLAGARFYVYRDLAARLERALINFMLDLHTTEHGYTEIFGPFIVNDESMIGTGQYPKFVDEYYRIERDGLSLIPTAEVTLTNLYRDEILEREMLPLYVTMQSACFRREAGAAGRDTKGLIRVHQFQKVELVKFVEPEHSFEELDRMVSNAEEVLKRLNLHYRVVILCSGDTSAASAKTYDIEVWMPGLNRYLEVSSCSNFLDYQARRARIRYRRARGEKPVFVHTLNGSGLAAGRTLAALMENYQREDGSIEIPEALKNYLK